MAKRTRQLFTSAGKYRCRVSPSEARAMERLGFAYKVWEYTDDGRRTGNFYFVESVLDSKSRSTAATITTRECIANAGLVAGYGEIRAARRKVREWPNCHDDRAVCISAGRVIGATLVSGIDRASPHLSA